MVELRSARKREASQPPQAPKPEREETSMEVPVEAPSEARTAKKRALTNPVRDEGPDEFQTEMRVLLKSLSEAVAMLNDKVDALDGKFNALEARCEGRREKKRTVERGASGGQPARKEEERAARGWGRAGTIEPFWLVRPMSIPGAFHQRGSDQDWRKWRALAIPL
ncbi:hypothetical protein HPB47_013607 [Ixodes persulcatus]|uniref:Uncharacterized protein n=1 Tax=Ixodes persulcatus TaxID=34615 RepID=A0AC60QZ30_IXOPE|nr:hypothetical protein HPB47_013607 [Ixodes persulcatus]